MIGVYSAPAAGYVQCWPTRDMGKDRAAALYLVGVTAESLPGAKLSGWLAIPDGGEPIRLQAGSASEARRACVPLAPVTLCRGVAHGRAYLYERRERLLPLSPSQAVKDKGLSLVAPGTGVLVAKAFNPRNARDLRVLASQLANQLTPLDFQAAKDALEQALQRLDVNWPALSQSQSSKVWREADRVLKQVLKSAHGEMLPTYIQRITVSLEDIAASTKAALHSSFLPRIGTSLEQRDVRAVERIAHQQGWWVRDEWGVRSDKLTERGRSIVQRGLADGLGRAEIGADLRRAMPEMWAKMGDTYAKLNAGMATSRGRSYSELSSYQEAGISRFEIVAVIDESTTDCCRALDGQNISVGAAAALQEQQMHLSEPEDIRTVSPLINTVRSDGRTFLETANGDRISEVLRSGYGVVDDRGQNSYSRMGDQLAAAGIGLPPYHFQALAEGTMIATADGALPIESIRPGTVVRTHRNRLRRVYAAMSKDWSEKILRVETDTGRVILVTEEHPVLTSHGWKPAGDMEVGDVLFESLEQLPGALEEYAIRASGRSPENFPTLLHQERVAYDVVASSLGGEMILPIDLQDDHVGREGEVNDVLPDWSLCLEKDSGGSEDAEDESLSECRRPLVRAGDRPCSLFSRFAIEDGVPVCHSLGVGLADGVGFLPSAEHPVIFPSLAIETGRSEDNLDLCNSSTNFDTVPLAPEVETGRRDAEGPLDGSDGFLPVPMSALDEIPNRRFVREIDHGLPPWVDSTIIAIAEVDCKGKVYNLAVEEDETYVAEGIIVHNCRSLSVPRTDMVSVPSGFTPVAASGPAPTTAASLKVKAAPDIETPEAAFELRPLELVPLPKRGEPVIHGTGSMLDEVPLPPEFGFATSGLRRWYGDTGKMEFTERPAVDLGDDTAADLARAENLIPAGDGPVLLDLAAGNVRLCAAVIASRDDVAHREVLLRARGLWVRFSGSQVPYQARRKFRRGFEAGEPDPEPLLAVVGRVGHSLDEVAVSRSERVATGSTTERKRRPSWSDPVLLPGVPLEEQVAKRTNRVRAELKARIDSAIHRERYLRGDEDERAGGDLPLLPKEDRAGIVAREIRAALRLHAEHGHASKRVVALFDGEPPSDPAEAMTALQGLGVHEEVAALLLRSAVDDGVVVGSMLPGRTMDLADMRVREPVLADGAWHSRDEYREALVDEPGRILIAAAARIREDDRELALSWETFPEHIAAYVSVMRGHYVR